MVSAEAARPKGKTHPHSFYPHVFPQLIFVAFVLAAAWTEHVRTVDLIPIVLFVAIGLIVLRWFSYVTVDDDEVSGPDVRGWRRSRIPLALIDKERSTGRPWIDRVLSRRRIWARDGGGIVIFTNMLGPKATREILNLVGVGGPQHKV